MFEIYLRGTITSDHSGRDTDDQLQLLKEIMEVPGIARYTIIYYKILYCNILEYTTCPGWLLACCN